MRYNGTEFRIRELDFSKDVLKDTDLSAIIDDCVVEADSKTLALGTIRTLAELTLQLEEGSKRNRVLAFHSIMKYGLGRAEVHGYKSVYVRVTDAKFEEVLKRHYGFSDVNGKYLVREV